MTKTDPSEASVGEADGSDAIIRLMRVRTPHDFTLYKRGTLQRRIERRMAIAGIAADDTAAYLSRLNGDDRELDLLAQDLLINVTQFFRDPGAFVFLAEHVLPALLQARSGAGLLRVWVAGCSTGEESYSLAIILLEVISSAKMNVTPQIFASDVDPDAIAKARAGFYPQTIEAAVSAARLSRFFTKEEDGYRVKPELRGCIVFTVQDLLADPPLSGIDLVSCRNLLIYLMPVAQAKALSLFHFALRQDGILLLGSSETVGQFETFFEPIGNAERVFRHVAPSRPGEVDFASIVGHGFRPLAPAAAQTSIRRTSRAEMFQQTVLDTLGSAAVLINHQNECLNSMGPTSRYLSMVPGPFRNDLVAMVRPMLRPKLRSAIHQAMEKGVAIKVHVSGAAEGGGDLAMTVQPFLDEGEPLLAVCFFDDTGHRTRPILDGVPGDLARVAELESEAEFLRAELRRVERRLELSAEAARAINEEAVSAREEYQSTNEELLTSKEELQAVNGELSALNSQIQGTLEHARTTSSDLQNILYSTDVATLFLDARLNIRFFTPATRSLFSVIQSDIGRPLADLHALSADSGLLADAQTMLGQLRPIEREIEAQDGTWYNRRIQRYRTPDGGVEGVVITYADISERKRMTRTLELAKQRAEQDTRAKSQFLAAASHDLRQPLQTLKLVHGLLTRRAQGEATQKLVGMLEPTLSAMSAMLNTLLDMNQIDSGGSEARIGQFRIADLLDRMRDEFAYHADARNLVFHVVPCTLSVCTDLALLERIMRNFLSNALKYTPHGKILLGCRRRGGVLSIEVWDTGIGIAAPDLARIFEEYHQIDNAAQERSLGLGLGLAVVQKLADLLGHRLRVRSQPGRGSVFAIEVDVAPDATPIEAVPHPAVMGTVTGGSAHRVGSILVIDDDPALRTALSLILTEEGHQVMTAADGPAALALVARGIFRPQLILTDKHLPNGPNGLQTALELRERLHRGVPIIVLTGDLSADAMPDTGVVNCEWLGKPAKPQALIAAIERLLPHVRATPRHSAVASSPQAADADQPAVIYIVDDDRHVRDSLRRMLEEEGRIVADYASCEAFLEAYRPSRDSCLLVDAYLPGMHGLELLQRLNEMGHRLPTIMITGDSDVPTALQAIKAGASDFIEKPVGDVELIASIDRALEQARDSGKISEWRTSASHALAALTVRQRDVMERVLAGHPSKNIASDLGISQRTVENHRAAIMRKTGSRSLPGLARMAVAAGMPGGG